MEREAKIYVAGHTGLAGSALVRRLQAAGFQILVLRSHADLNLGDESAVSRFFSAERPRYVFLAAARVGGILANSNYPAEFIFENLRIETNVIQQAQRHGVERLLFLGSSCIYPRNAPQPMTEEYLMSGPLEWTNRPYAIAKIAGIEMCWACNRQYGTRFLAAMPTNLYGPNDNYDVESSHVVPALIRKFHEAKVRGADRVEVWGTGEPRREFLHSDDSADACLFLMNLPEQEFARIALSPQRPPLVNVGCGEDLSITELAQMLAEVAGFKGHIIFDRAKPNGTPRKLLDVSILKSLGWKPKISLRDGLSAIYKEYCLRSTATPEVPISR